MSIRISRKDIIWNYAGNIINIGVNIIILPAVLKILTSQELGLWYVFGSLLALVNLMDFGFSPTIMRNISYAWSGSKKILAEGTPDAIVDGKPNFALLRSLLISSKKIYFIISAAASVILLSAGTLYIISLLPQKNISYLIAWLVYAVAIFVNLLYSYWTPVLKGIGKIKEANQVMLISKLTYIIFAISGLLLGGGLIWLSLSYLVSGLLLQIFSKRFFLKISDINNKKYELNDEYDTHKIFRIIWPNAQKQGIVTVGAWLITKASTLLCSSILGLEITSQYGLSLQLLGVVGSFSSLLFNSYVPELASSKVCNDSNRYNRIFSRAIALQWLLGILGIGFIILFGPTALTVIGSNSEILPRKIMLILGIVLFLEWNHSTFATLITLSNTVPFVKASILSGISILIFSFIIINYTGLGILGLIIVQGIVQLAYNNWYWPRVVLLENKLSIIKIIKSSVGELQSLLINK